MNDRAPQDLRAWTMALFRAIDTKDTAGFMAFLAPGCPFRMGNMPPASGEGLRAMLDGFFGMLESLSHTVESSWSVPGHVVCHGRVKYVRRDGRGVEVPFCNVLRVEGEKVVDYRIFMDPSPLMAA